MTHLNAAVLLGNPLRKEVHPRLAAHNTRCANVLFVTDKSFTKSELQSDLCYWSLKKVKIPYESEHRLNTHSGT